MQLTYWGDRSSQTYRSVKARLKTMKLFTTIRLTIICIIATNTDIGIAFASVNSIQPSQINNRATENLSSDDRSIPMPRLPGGRFPRPNPSPLIPGEELETPNKFEFEPNQFDNAISIFMPQLPGRRPIKPNPHPLF